MVQVWEAWLCWLVPLAGAPTVFLADRAGRKARDILALTFPLASLIISAMLLPRLFSLKIFEEELLWIPVPGFNPVSIGVLLDPLSIIMANIVSFISFLIMVYSVKYMEHEQGVARYWFFMNLFIGGMLLLVLSNNFIFFLVGWKLVGLCSYALIGHYYRDEPEYWVGGPEPTPKYSPSYCGLKAWIVTSLGDTLLLGGLILLFVYAGTANFTELFQLAGEWLPEAALRPGMLTLIAVLLLSGPLGKSAQFPLHEWLPEAMAGPAPVSALIHAATMVKAGVYLVARFLPVFYYGYWMLGLGEALNFFLLAAGIGAFTALLAGSQAMVSLELKKALAYSTVSQIGYMMLALGVAGFTPQALVYGYVAGLLHLASHALFKASLFLGSGTVI
ncbi:NADH-quinone oxidoreductase subunit L, partial [Candidatus Bathyarchaeota archaeon]